MRHGPHQVAQKLIITIFLSRITSLSFTGLPLTSGNSKSGIGSWIFKAATGLFSRRSSVFTAKLKTANKHKNKITAALLIARTFSKRALRRNSKLLREPKVSEEPSRLRERQNKI